MEVPCCTTVLMMCFEKGSCPLPRGCADARAAYIRAIGLAWCPKRGGMYDVVAGSHVVSGTVLV